MAIIKFDKINPSSAIHPGHVLASELKNSGISQKELSEIIGKSTPVINDIIKGKRGINAEIAVLLEKALDVKAEDWMNYQCLYDLDQVKQDDKLKYKCRQILIWNKIKPMFRMSKLKKYITFTGDISSDIQNIFSYVGVSSIEQLESVFNKKGSMFRKSECLQVDLQNLFTWILIVRHLSNNESLEVKFDKEKTKKLIERLNDLFYYNKEVEINVNRILKEYGIKYVQLKHMDKVPVDGYSFWSGNNPTIVLTKRFNRLDNYAFTLMHELGHICLHLTENSNYDFLEADNTEQSKKLEEEADKFAQENLSRGLKLEPYFNKWKNPYAAENFLKTLSRQTHINVSIITGQYQHHCDSYTICRNLLETIG